MVRKARVFPEAKKKNKNKDAFGREITENEDAPGKVGRISVNADSVNGYSPARQGWHATST